MGKATQDLMHEHETILYVLEILDKMVSDTEMYHKEKRRYRCELVEFLKIFADKCHHGKEENILFKAMVESGIRNEGGPIGVMLGEHTQGRAYILQMTFGLIAGDMASFNEAAARYSELLKVHISKENTILFKMADQVLDEDKQSEIYERFQEHEETVIGHGVHEQLHAQIEAWANAYDMGT